MPFKVKLVRTPAFITCNTKSEGGGGEKEGERGEERERRERRERRREREGRERRWGEGGGERGAGACDVMSMYTLYIIN